MRLRNSAASLEKCQVRAMIRGQANQRSFADLPVPLFSTLVEPLLRQGKIRFRITSGSMSPALKPGDLVEVKEVRREGDRQIGETPLICLSPSLLGQILVVNRNGTLLCHRFVRTFEDETGLRWVVTRAEKSTVEDPPVPIEQVVGQVTRVLQPRIFHQTVWRLKQRFTNWRLAFTRIPFFLARALEFFPLAIPKPKQLIECNRRKFSFLPFLKAYRVSEAIDFFPHEKKLLDRLQLKPDRVLVLGCGNGRDSIALAREGWQVTGIDFSSPLIEAARSKAQELGLPVEWHCRDVTEGFPEVGSFSLICLFGMFYSYIPGRVRRVELFKACRNRLRKEGVCLVSFSEATSSPSWRAKLAHVLRRGLAWFLRGNTECQLGDIWAQGSSFIHQFSRAEFEEEARGAGFFVTGEDTGIPRAPAVLRLK